MIGVVIFAATLGLKSERFDRALLHDESTMVNYNLGLPTRIIRNESKRTKWKKYQSVEAGS